MTSHTLSTTAEVIALEAAHTSGVYPKRQVALVKGAGARVWDADGNEYVDCVAGIGSGNVGHCHPKVVEAIRAQAGELLMCPESFYHPLRARLLGRLTAAAGMPRAFLCSSGTEANEGALKFARLFTKRSGVVACMRGFHGRSMGALSATWEKHYREPFLPLVPGFSHVPYDDLAKLEAAVTDETGAVLLEVVQGEGGVRPGSAEFLAGAQRLCRERGALLILDEVQTGFGRTGAMFAFQRYGLEPDLVCVAKSLGAGVPVGAILIGERLGELPPRVHGSTFGGNPLACATALAVLDVIEEEGLAARAEALGAKFRAALAELGSPLVREVRGLGLMVGVELKRKVAPVVEALFRRGVLALPTGTTVIRFLPPLVIEEELLLGRVVTAVGEALAEVAASAEQEG